MSRRLKRRVWYALGVLICTLPPALACIEHFPLWKERGAGVTVSAVSLIMLAIILIPLKRAVGRYIKSPSAWLIWLAVLAVSLLVRNVIDSMVSIALISAISNAIGAICFKIASVYKHKKEE